MRLSFSLCGSKEKNTGYIFNVEPYSRISKLGMYGGESDSELGVRYV